jgi:hypothetical protein
VQREARSCDAQQLQRARVVGVGGHLRALQTACQLEGEQQVGGVGGAELGERLEVGAGHEVVDVEPVG